MDEEETTDRMLTALATSVINLAAEQEQAEAPDRGALANHRTPRTAMVVYSTAYTRSPRG